MKAMLLSAGLGTRLKPFTDKHPKALAVVNSKTILQRNIEYLASFGINDVIVNVHHFANQIIEAITTNNGYGSRVSISNEENEVLETGGGLKKASWYFEDGKPFLLINVDILTDLNINDLAAFHYKMNGLATLAITTRSSSRYFLFDEENRLAGWRNTNTGEEKIRRHSDVLVQKAFSGIHLLSPEIFPLMKQEGKFSMVDVYLELAAEQEIRGFDHSNSKLIDVGKPESIIKAGEMFT